jgi:Zn-dependent peptidase ImmA (M78 family)
MKCVNNLKNKNIFQDINYIIDNIDSFELYSIKKTDIFINKNQLFIHFVSTRII